MKNPDKLKKNIEELRENLVRLIQAKEDLLDPEIVRASQKLDKALDKYNFVLFGPVR